MNFTLCDTFKYWNNKTNKCEPCTKYQLIYTIITLVILVIHLILLCLKQYIVLCPIFVLVLIGLNQILCYEYWPDCAVYIFLIIEFLLLICALNNFKNYRKINI